MNKEKLKVGIAGYGVVGKRRHKYIDRHPAFQVVAVCDVAFEQSGSFDDGIRYYSDYHSLLEEELDVLFVSLPNYLAPEVTICGLESGMHVFCEKPPGRTVEDIARVINIERQHPLLKLKYGFNHRYHHSVREALRLVQSQELGEVINLRGTYGKSKIISFDSTWRTKRDLCGGGILLDQGIHMVDMMRLFAGEFTQVHSFISNDFWKHDVEDNAYALMRTDNGVVAMLHSSATQWRHRFQLEITLTKGQIILDGILSSSKSYGAETMTVAYASADHAGDPLEKTIRYNEDPSWKDEIYDFADAILQNREISEGSSGDALKTMQLVYKIYWADDEWRKKYDLFDKAP
jgi:predicted dehydrogenase